tara:strand:+ start:209 stop:445 length:237 start_codon:yes stop_codon:yes gene_type:complete
MKMIYRILLVCFLGLSLSLARTSGNFPTPDDFLSSKNSPHTKKEFTQGSGESGDQSIKWKRRHKRRKRDKNRRPQRGR